MRVIGQFIGQMFSSVLLEIQKHFMVLLIRMQKMGFVDLFRTSHQVVIPDTTSSQSTGNSPQALRRHSDRLRRRIRRLLRRERPARMERLGLLAQMERMWLKLGRIELK